MALAEDCLQDVFSPFIANDGIVGEGKVGKVNYGWGVNPYVICAIGVDATGMDVCANIACEEVGKSCSWEIWSGYKKIIHDPNPDKGACCPRIPYIVTGMEIEILGVGIS